MWSYFPFPHNMLTDLLSVYKRVVELHSIYHFLYKHHIMLT